MWYMVCSHYPCISSLLTPWYPRHGMKMLQLFMCTAMHSTSKYVGGNKNYNDTCAYMYILCRVDRAHRRNHQKGRHATRGQPTSAPFTTVGPPDDAAARTAFAVTTNGGISLESQVGVRCSSPKGGYPGAPALL